MYCSILFVDTLYWSVHLLYTDCFNENICFSDKDISESIFTVPENRWINYGHWIRLYLRNRLRTCRVIAVRWTVLAIFFLIDSSHKFEIQKSFCTILVLMQLSNRIHFNKQCQLKLSYRIYWIEWTDYIFIAMKKDHHIQQHHNTTLLPDYWCRFERWIIQTYWIRRF